MRTEQEERDIPLAIEFEDFRHNGKRRIIHHYQSVILLLGVVSVWIERTDKPLLVHSVPLGYILLHCRVDEWRGIAVIGGLLDGELL